MFASLEAMMINCVMQYTVKIPVSHIRQWNSVAEYRCHVMQHSRLIIDTKMVDRAVSFGRDASLYRHQSQLFGRLSV